MIVIHFIQYRHLSLLTSARSPCYVFKSSKNKNGFHGPSTWHLRTSTKPNRKSVKDQIRVFYVSYPTILIKFQSPFILYNSTIFTFYNIILYKTEHFAFAENKISKVSKKFAKVWYRYIILDVGLLGIRY